MNEIEAEECYKAIGVLLAHVDSLEEFTILDNIHHGDEYEMEIRIQCDDCGKLGVRVYNYADITNWD